jgi:hypothetical protein
MPTIKLKDGKVVTKDGKPSCTCCCSFYIYADIYTEEFDPLAEYATIYIVNNSSSPLEITSLVYTVGGAAPSLTPALPPVVAGYSTTILTLDESFSIQGLYLTAQTSCGEYTFDIPYIT